MCWAPIDIDMCKKLVLHEQRQKKQKHCMKPQKGAKVATKYDPRREEL